MRGMTEEAVPGDFQLTASSGIPIVTLETSSYIHEKYDEVFTPVLPIKAWKSERELTGGEADYDADLNDDVPF